MVEFYDRTRIDLLSSEEYIKADKERRGKMLRIYDEASEEERKDMVYGTEDMEGLTLNKKSFREGLGNLALRSPKLIPAVANTESQSMVDRAVRVGKVVLPLGVDILGQAGGAAIGAASPVPGGALIGGMAGAVGADKLNRAIGLRDPKKVDLPIPFMEPMKNEKLIGPVTTGDVAAASGPVIGAGLNALGRGLVRPVTKAITKADDVNATAKAKYDTRLVEINQEFKEDIAKIAGDRLMGRAEKAQTLAARKEAYQNRLRTHTQAYNETPTEGFKGLPKVGGHEQYYSEAEKYARAAGNGSVPSLKQTADELTVKLGQPVDPLQSRFKNVTEALSDLGDGDVPLSRMIETQKKLGRVIGRTHDGEERRAAQKLYESLDQDMLQMASANPHAKAAIIAQKEASERFKRMKIQEEWQALFKKNSTPISKTETELNIRGLRRDFRDFLEENPFVKNGLSHAEKARLSDMVEELPKYRVGAPPVETPFSDNTRAFDDRIFQHERQVRKHGQPPTPVEPELESFPVAKAILTKVAGSEIVGRLQGLGGPNPSAGIVAALGIFGLPTVVSMKLIKTPGGRQLAQDIASGKIQLTPSMRLAISEAIRQIDDD